MLFTQSISIPFSPETGYLQIQVNDRLTKRFLPIELHFHVPAEHTIAGQTFDLEMHIVHQYAEGTLAVLAILFEVGDAPNVYIE